MKRGAEGRRAAALVMIAIAAASMHAAGAFAYSRPATGHLTTFHVPAKSAAPFARVQAPVQAPSRATAPVITVPSTAPGQTGYVHYFVITGPDGEPETQVGLELPGDRIAWSFPETGVSISPFIKSGQIVTNGKTFEIEHLYGIRTFPDDESMASLRRGVEARVGWWIDQKTPYCDEADPSNRLCLSCLGFVLRVIYPGASPAWPALPSDFRSARRNVYSTEDLLMYLAGVRIDGSREARARRIQSLNVPDSMREELARISSEVLGDAAVAKAGVNEPHGAKPRPTKPAVAKPRSVGRAVATPKRVAPRAGS